MPTKKQTATKPARKSKRKPKELHKKSGPKPQTRLTLQQQRFIDSYLLRGNVKWAASEAGCHVATAYIWLNTPLVANEVFSRIKIIEQRAQVNQEYVLKTLQREAEYYGEDASHASRVESLKTIAKILRMFADSVEVRGDRNNPIQLDHAHTHDHSGLIKLDVRAMSLDQCKQLLDMRKNGDHEGIQRTVQTLILEQQGAKHGTNAEEQDERRAD